VLGGEVHRHHRISVYATDLDGDGDPDVLSASRGDHKIAWYENDGSEPDGFGPQQVINPSADGAMSVYATDLDGDGDADVLSASTSDDTIAWYENDGVDSDGFGDPQVITTADEADGAASVYAADLDGDLDPDVLFASYLDNKIGFRSTRPTSTATATPTCSPRPAATTRSPGTRTMGRSPTDSAPSR
jgi:hypothetical protein